MKKFYKKKENFDVKDKKYSRDGIIRYENIEFHNMAQKDLDAARLEYYKLSKSGTATNKKLKRLEKRIDELNSDSKKINESIKTLIKLSPKVKHVKDLDRDAYFPNKSIGDPFNILAEINETLVDENAKAQIFIFSQSVSTNKKALGGTRVEKNNDLYIGRVELDMKSSIDDFSTFANEIGDVYNDIVNRESKWKAEDDSVRNAFLLDNRLLKIKNPALWQREHAKMYEKLNDTKISFYIQKAIEQTVSK